MLDVRLVHHLQELARIGGERLHVAALALGVDGVEREARLARTGQAGDDRQALTRDVDIHTLEVVLASATNAYVGQHSLPLCFGMWVSISLFVPDLFLLFHHRAGRSMRSGHVGFR